MPLPKQRSPLKAGFYASVNKLGPGTWGTLLLYGTNTNNCVTIHACLTPLSASLAQSEWSQGNGQGPGSVAYPKVPACLTSNLAKISRNSISVSIKRDDVRHTGTPLLYARRIRILILTAIHIHIQLHTHTTHTHSHICTWTHAHIYSWHWGWDTPAAGCMANGANGYPSCRQNRQCTGKSSPVIYKALCPDWHIFCTTTGKQLHLQKIPPQPYYGE